MLFSEVKKLKLFLNLQLKGAQNRSSHQLTTTFYCIPMSLKRPLVPKSDVK